MEYQEILKKVIEEREKWEQELPYKICISDAADAEIFNVSMKYQKELKRIRNEYNDEISEIVAEYLILIGAKTLRKEGLL